MTIHSVTNQAELTAALQAAAGGDVIELAAGDYGDLLVRNLTFDSAVTIVSAPGVEVHFDTVRVINVENLSFQSIDVGRPLAAGEANHVPMAIISGSKGVSFNAVHVHGSLDGNPLNDGNGVQIRDSENTVISNSEVEQVRQGINVLNSVGTRVLSNDIHDIVVDGIVLWQARSVVIDRNRIHDFYVDGVSHPDGIQFFATNSTIPSSDIRITNNQIFQGAGDGIQGVFMRDESGSNPFYNVHISNNIVYMGESWNGIAVYNGVNVEVVNNTVLSPTTDSFDLRIWLQDVANASIGGNLADYHGGADLDTLLSANVFLNRNPGFYTNLPNIDIGARATVDDLIVDGIGYRPPVQGGESVIDTRVGTSLGEAISRIGGGEQAQSSAMQAQEAVPADDEEATADAPASTASAAVYSVAAIDDVELDLTPPKAPEQTEGAAGGLSDFLSEGVASNFAGDAAYSRTAIADQHFGGSAFDASTFGADSGIFDFGAYMRGSMAEFLLHADMHIV